MMQQGGEDGRNVEAEGLAVTRRERLVQVVCLWGVWLLLRRVDRDVGIDNLK